MSRPMRPTGDSWASEERAGVKWRVRAAILPRFREWCARHFPAVFGDQGALLKDTVGSRVAAAGGWVIKEGTARKGRSRLRYGLRASGARRAAALALRARARGVPTPLPVAWATVRDGVFRVREYLVTEEVPGARPLTELLDMTGPGDAARREIAGKYGRLLGAFHAAGMSNRDLKDQNVLVAAGGGMWALDMDGVRAMPRLPRWRAGRDFYAVARSLGLHGWRGPDVQAALLAGYNGAAPARLRRDSLPFRDVFLREP